MRNMQKQKHHKISAKVAAREVRRLEAEKKALDELITRAWKRVYHAVA